MSDDVYSPDELTEESTVESVYVVGFFVKYEGTSNIAVCLDENQAQGLANRLNKRCDTFYGKYVVSKVDLDPDPVAVSQRIGEVDNGNLPNWAQKRRAG